MTKWIVVLIVAVLMLCEMVFSVPSLFAQTAGGPFEQLSPGNQKGARALYDAQKADPRTGAKPVTLDQIAARKHSGEGWTRMFQSMKSQGLIEGDSFGQVIESYDSQHQVSRRPDTVKGQ